MNLRFKKFDMLTFFKINNIVINNSKEVIFSIIFLMASSNIFAQDLDEDFLNSLPEDIRSEVISNIESSQGSEIVQTKDYESFSSSTSVNKEQNSDEMKLQKFGESFFNKIPSTFMPINDPSASYGYILDVDDLIFIQIIGDRSDQYEYRIDRSGNISIKDVGFIKIAGLSIDSATKLINETLKKYFVETEAVISLKEARDINILITGYVNNPGFYVLGGYSNVFHAIKIAGGIAENGSFRNIEIKRNGETIFVFDLYDAFINGDTSSSISLRSGDAIIVSSSNKFIPIIGAVKRQAIYEFKENETVGNIIDFAGGFSLDANPEKEILLIRLDDNELKTINKNVSKTDNVYLRENDRLFVKYKNYKRSEDFISESEEFIDNPVIVSGAVKFPGKYYIKQNQNLSDLINEFGGYKNDAYIFGASLLNEKAKLLEKEYNSRLYNDAIKSLANVGTISRTNQLDTIPALLNEFKEISPQGRVITEFSPEKIEADPSLDIRLSPGDKIHIPYFQKVVYVFGEVLNSGTQIYDDNIAIEDYIKKSGGLNEYADSSSIIIVHPNGESERIQLRLFSGMRYTIHPGSVIYIPRDLKQIDGLELGSVMAPIISSLAISLASLNSISNN